MKKYLLLFVFLPLQLAAQSGIGVAAMQPVPEGDYPYIQGAIKRSMDGAMVESFSAQWKCGPEKGTQQFQHGSFRLLLKSPARCDFTFSAPDLKSVSLTRDVAQPVFFDVKMDGFRAIRGQVISDGQPGRSVHLFLSGGDKKFSLQAYSDEDGKFQYVGLIPGEYQISMQQPLLLKNPVTVRVTGTEDPPPVTLTLPATGRLVIQLAPGHEKIPEFSSPRLYRQSADSHLRYVEQSGGQYLSEAVPPGSYVLYLDFPISRVLRVTLAAGTASELALDLTPLPFRGRFLLGDHPLANRAITLRHIDQFGLPEGSHQGSTSPIGRFDKGSITMPLMTDEEGGLKLDNLAPGRYLLEAGAIRFPFDVIHSPQAETLIRLPEGKISGHAKDERGVPVQDLTMMLFSRTSQGSLEIWDCACGKDGSFLFEGLPDGLYKLFFRNYHDGGDTMVTIKEGKSDKSEIKILVPKESNWPSR